MTTGFGRKGLTAGAAYAPTMGQGIRDMARAEYPAAGTISDDAVLTRSRQAFLASERARNGGLSDVAADFSYDRGKPTRSLMLAYLLWFIACGFSAHRFYLGAYRSALTQVGLWVGAIALMALGLPAAFAGMFILGAGLWMLVDAFLIPGLHRKYCS